MKVALILLLFCSGSGIAQKLIVKESISVTRKGQVLAKGSLVALSDSVRVAPGGLLMLSDKSGIVFYIPTGWHLVRAFYERKMSHLTHSDSLQVRLASMGVPRCDSIDRANQKQARSMHQAIAQKESAPIQLKGSVTKQQVELSWKGKAAPSYTIIATDLMEELVFVEESKTPSFTFNGEPYENLLIRIFAQGCYFSNHVVIVKRGGQPAIVR